MRIDFENGSLGGFIKDRTRGQQPCPLKTTAYAVEIHSGLAVVTAVRTFRNDESSPIEAVLTFPVPFEAVVTSLRTKVAGRELVGRAEAKAKARQSYEAAVDAGKAAVLHEELLRGLHMLSVANVAPGAEIEVTATFAAPLAHFDGTGRLTVPMTVAQIYGSLPLPDSDQLVTDGPSSTVELTVSCAAGTVLVNGGALPGGKAVLPDNLPISLQVIGGDLSPLAGRAADGRSVELSFRPSPQGEAALDADVLLDTSGSMSEAADENSSDGRKVSKWDVVRAGLAGAAGRTLDARDALRLWTFSNATRLRGSSDGEGLRALVESCPFDGGGTEIGVAVATVAESRRDTNVLLVTDGRSGRPIDVQKAVASGSRYTVVLVGKSSLEASVAHLAAMTGGQAYVVDGGDADLAIVAAFAAMRRVSSPVRPASASASEVVRGVSGLDVEARWSDAAEGAPAREGLAATVAAYAANLAIPGMDEEAASALAVAEGLVGHLTSLVLVDEEGAAVQGVPSSRKVALPEAAGAMMTRSAFRSAAGPQARSFLAAAPGPGAMFSIDSMAVGGSLRGGGDEAYGLALSGGDAWFMEEAPRDTLQDAIDRVNARGGDVSFPGGRGKGKDKGPGVPRTPYPTTPAPDMVPRGGRWPYGDAPDLMARPAVMPTADAKAAGKLVDWDADAAALSEGRLTGLDGDAHKTLWSISNLAEVAALASSLGKQAMLVALALAGEAAGTRTSLRIARKVLEGADATLLDAARKAARAV